MMCFRDMTFCNAKCANEACPRKFTEQVQRDADKWWRKPGAPIALSDFSEHCDKWEQSHVAE